MKPRAWTRIGAASSVMVAGLVLGACGGDAVATGSYRGEPLASFDGTISGLTTTTAPAAPKVGLLWIISMAWYPGNDDHQSWGETTSITATSFPAQFNFDVFDPPPESIYPIENGAVVPFATAMILAVDDVNQDGRFEPGDQENQWLEPPDVALGMASTMMILYVRDASALQKAAQLPFSLSNPQALGVGYNLLRAVSPDNSFQDVEVAPLDTEITIGALPNS
jgi:hypothetical protein